MTQQEQRIAIAEWMGWKLVQPKSEYGTSPIYPRHVTVIPNYPNDLNAMHEAELNLSIKLLIAPHKDSDRIRYALLLTETCGIYGAIIASSQQRSEALCRKLWPERFE